MYVPCSSMYYEGNKYIYIYLHVTHIICNSAITSAPGHEYGYN